MRKEQGERKERKRGEKQIVGKKERWKQRLPKLNGRRDEETEKERKKLEIKTSNKKREHGKKDKVKLMQVTMKKHKNGRYKEKLVSQGFIQ